MDRADSIDKLRGSHEALVRIGQSLSFQATDLQAGETADRIEAEQDVPCSSLLNLTLDHIARGCHCLGNALSISLSSQYGIRPFSVEDSQVCAATFNDFLEDLRTAGHDETVHVRLSVDKRQIVRHLNAPERTNIVVFAFLSNLLRALAGQFEEVQEIFFPQVQCRSICLLLEGGEMVQGPYFSVVGPGELEKEFSRRQSAKVANRISKIWETRRDNVSWIDFETKLTPIHFMISSETDHGTRLSVTVGSAFYALSVLYMADSVRRRENDYVATFSGLTQSQLLVRGEADVPRLDIGRTSRAFIWAYSSEATDKLTFLRSVATSYLGDNPETNYSALGRSIDRIWETARANYAAFIKGFVTRHFEKLREVDEYTRETSNKVSQQISELSRNLVMTMLATVGVIIGGVVAYGLNRATTPKLLSAGLRIYGLYIGIVPLLYFVIVYSLTSYLITVHDFKSRMKDFELVLHISDLSRRFSGAITPRKVHFWFTLILAISIYGALVFMCFRVAAILSHSQ